MTKILTTGDIAKAIGGKLVGDDGIKISRVAHPADVTGEGDIVLAIDDKLIPLLKDGSARAAIVSGGAEIEDGALDAYIIVERGRFAMAALTKMFDEQVFVAPGIHPSAVVEDGAKLGKGVAVGAFVYIGAGAVIGDGSVLHPQVYIGSNAVIGESALIHAGVKIGARVRIGARAIIHFNSSIGADGFSFVTPKPGSVESAKATGEIGAVNCGLVRIASLGAVVIGDDVEIGANTSIDRGTIASTRIGNGTKIDNQVQVGHNVVIGDNCLICGRVGIAGSVEIGNRVVLGGAVGIADHVKIGDDAIAMAMSGIAGNLPPKSLVMGAPAKPRAAIIEQMHNMSRIKSLIRKVESLSERLDGIEGVIKN
ncbi:MAG: UDP-3-O-(3-hydroxymyristoyl)glucosamine N-acyltransferase [Alphaproteobacteria bacterium]|nr:UDP-3-O-(3-hydroxymyristoyl)glucosamine N-acyltransferase [Alphaproteobacteria bacterium]